MRPWVKSYKNSIQEQKNLGASSVEPKIGKSRGRPLILDEAPNLKLCSMLVKLRLVGAGISIHVFSGVLNGLIRANPERFGKYMEFKVTRSWARSLYQRMKFSRRAVTTSSKTSDYQIALGGSKIAISLRDYIPDELIINVDQTLINSYHHPKRAFCCGIPLRPDRLQR